MKYFWFLTLIFIFSCKKSENKNNDNWILGEWKIIEQPFDFFPFDYDDRICILDNGAIIEFTSENQIIFKNKSNDYCKIIGHYSLELIDEFNQPISQWLRIKMGNKNFVYSIDNVEGNIAVIHSDIFPKHALKYVDISRDAIFLNYEKHGFEIKIQKTK